MLALLTLVPARAAGDQGAELMATLPNKPEVTIQGNVVVDEGGAPTGFYELALCVRSPRRIFGPDPATGYASSKELSEAEYATVLAAIEAGTTTITENDYNITYYPFSAASAVVNVNTDVLTAVHWDIQEVKYAAWDATTSTYAANDTAYPRGVDVAASADPEQWGETDPDPFPDVTVATMNKLGRNPVALDAEGDRSTFTAAAQADYYYTQGATKAAVVTLSAHAPDNKPVVYKTSTPVAVVRFSYDLKRFPKGIVKTNDAYNTNNLLGQITGDTTAGAAQGFWLGLSRDNGNTLFANGKTPITWLADTAMDGAGAPFSFSDALAAQTENGQVVWTRLSSKDTGATPDFKQTEYYYYLGAQPSGSNGTPGTVKVYTAADTFVEAEHVKIPTTQGTKILGSGTQENPEPAAGDTWTTTPYSFYSNILYLNEGVKLRLVNDLTFKKPTGGTGGNQILFYDWDDTLIGTLVVGDGDVRAQVNAYIEKTMVHPDLRVGEILKTDLGGNVPDYSAGAPAAGSPSEKYKNVLDSLDREYTYRGKYPYQLGGSTIQDDPNDLPGSEYPLTNKLDYAFYRHLNTVTTQEYADATTGATITDRYVTADALSTNQDAAQFPWVYGWAVVEDTGDYNTREWQVRRDAAKREDVWTTFGVGELSNLNPSFDLSTPGAQAIPALPGTPVGGGTGVETTYPAFVDPTAATAPTDYSYKLSSAGDARYLRFADFSDIGSEYRDGQDTLVVKAVYEPGTELMSGSSYQILKEPSYNKLNRKSAPEGGAYSATITLERVTGVASDGILRGASRVRDPAVRQDNTYDQKWIADNMLGVDHDLANADIQTAKKLTETLFAKVDVDNGDEVTFTLPLSARHNKVDYWLIDMYGSNFVSGGQRSETNFNQYGSAHVLDNYNYDSEDRATADSYYDKQDYYYQVTTYEDREGSHGFVLHGTLNALMEQATLVARGQAQTSDMNAAANYMVLRDANLRMDAGGTLPTAATQMALQTKIIDAAKACEAYKGNPDYWNDDLDCAQLSYHQLQWFIIDGSLRDRATADAATLPFCHLHKTCAALTSDKPKDWNDLMDKAKNDPDTIEQLRMDEIEAMTHLRRDLNGTPFPSVLAFKNALVAAVNAGCTTWDEIQYCIIHSGAMPTDNTEAQTKYWWYDGAANEAAVRPSTWDDFLAAVKSMDDPVALPDGTSRPSSAKLRLVESIFNTNLGLDENKVSSGYKSLTHNLVPSHTENEEEGTGTTGRFTDFESWLDLIIEAVKAMPTDGSVPAGQEWAWIQYYILHHGDPAWTAVYPFGADGVTDETVNYWWKDGGTRLVVNSVRTLLKAAAAAQSADPAEAAMGQAALDRVNWKLWDSFYLKKANGTDAAGIKQWADFRPAGVQDTDPVTADVMQLVKDAITADPDMLTWEPLQYYLIHAAAGTTDQIDGESPYYWWKDGGLGKELDFPAAFSTANAKNTAGILIEAALWHRYGSPVAFNKLTDDIFAQTHLIQGIANSPAFEQTDLTKFADKATFLTKLYEFLDKGQATLGLEEYGFFAPEWFQMQYAFLNGGTYLPISDPAIIATVTDYWWYDKENNKPPTPTKPEEPSDKLMGYIEQFLNDGLTEAQLKGKITDKKMNGKNTADPTENFFIYRTNAGATWTAFNIATAKTRIANLAKLIKGDPTKYADYYKDGKLTLYWAQIQVYVVEQKLESNADALNKIVNTWGWKKVADGGKIPDAIDTSGVPSGTSLLDEVPLKAEPTPEVQAAPEPETPADNEYNERLEIPLGEEAQAAIANDLPRKIVTYRSLVPRKTT